jgi:hypothetical protein
MKSVLSGFAIVRVDRFQEDDEQRFTVKRVVWSQDFAESEVQRLNEVNADKDCIYRWQYTRVDPLPARPSLPELNRNGGSNTARWRVRCDSVGSEPGCQARSFCVFAGRASEIDAGGQHRSTFRRFTARVWPAQHGLCVGDVSFSVEAAFPLFNWASVEKPCSRRVCRMRDTGRGKQSKVER